MDEPPPVKHPVLFAAAWMLGAILTFTITAVAARRASSEVSTIQILFFRSIVGVLVLTPFLAYFGWRHAKTSHFRTHLLRNIAHFGGQFGWVYGLAAIPLAMVFAIEFTTPIWTALFAAIMLGERLSRPRVLAVFLGIAGVLVILRPGFEAVQPAAVAVLLSAMAYAMSHTMTKRLVGVDPPLTVLFYMTVIQLPIGLAGSLTHWATPSLATLPWLAVVGTSALGSHYCLARALKLADAMVVVPIDFLRLPLACVVGYFLYEESPTIFLFAGAVLMLAGNLLGLRAEHRSRKAADVTVVPDE